MQAFVRGARLGLEPGLDRHAPRSPGCGTAGSPPSASGRRCAQRELYRENWIEWDELRARPQVEAFRFLEQQLRRATLTVAVPGGLDWWPDAAPGAPAARGAAGPRAGPSQRLLPPRSAHEGLGPARHTRSATPARPGSRRFSPRRLAGRRQPGGRTAGGGGNDGRQVGRDAALPAPVGGPAAGHEPLPLLDAGGARPRHPVRARRRGRRAARVAPGFMPAPTTRGGACCDECGGEQHAGSRRVLLLAQRLAVTSLDTGRSARCRRRRPRSYQSLPIRSTAEHRPWERPGPAAGAAGVATQARSSTCPGAACTTASSSRHAARPRACR